MKIDARSSAISAFQAENNDFQAENNGLFLTKTKLNKDTTFSQSLLSSSQFWWLYQCVTFLCYLIVLRARQPPIILFQKNLSFVYEAIEDHGWSKSQTKQIHFVSQIVKTPHTYPKEKRPFSSFTMTKFYPLWMYLLMYVCMYVRTSNVPR